MSLGIIVFELKNDGKKWSRTYFEIHRAPSEILAKLPGQFGHFLPSFLSKNGNFKTRDFSPLIKRVLAGVPSHVGIGYK